MRFYYPGHEMRRLQTGSQEAHSFLPLGSVEWFAFFRFWCSPGVPTKFHQVFNVFISCSQCVPNIFFKKSFVLNVFPSSSQYVPKGVPNSTLLQSHMFGLKCSPHPFNWMLNHWNMCSKLGIEKLLLQVWWKLWFMGEKVKMHVQFYFCQT
jgi:hypothetical protein